MSAGRDKFLMAWKFIGHHLVRYANDILDTRWVIVEQAKRMFEKRGNNTEYKLKDDRIQEGELE